MSGEQKLIAIVVVAWIIMITIMMVTHA